MYTDERIYTYERMGKSYKISFTPVSNQKLELKMSFVTTLKLKHEVFLNILITCKGM